MIISETTLAHESKRVLDRVVEQGEIVQVQRQGRTVAEIRPRMGVTRLELLQLLRNRGFTKDDSRQLQCAMDAVSEVLGYAGRD